MSAACSAPNGPMGFIGSINAFIDCQAEIFGAGAFGALATPGSSLSLALTGLLTIFVALIGYNLLFGRGLDIRSGTIAMVKVGAVLALATSWPAYRTLIYDVVTQAPGQMVAELGRPSSLPGSDGTLVQHLDIVDAALQQLVLLGPGEPAAAPRAALVPPPAMASFNAFAFGGSRILFLMSALVGFASIRIVAALMLALGPYFIAFLLFENMRSLFEGWIRVIAAVTIGAIGVAIGLAFELALLEPWLAAVLAHRQAGEALPAAPTELFVLTLLFALVIVAIMISSARLATAFRLGSWRSRFAMPAKEPAFTATDNRIERGEGAAARSRATATAHMIANLQRRETAGRELAGDHRARFELRSGTTSGRPVAEISHGVPTGRAFPRRTKGRASLSAARRDGNI